MIRDHNIICIASNWFEHPTSKQHVMRALSDHNRVLWINFHASRRPRLTLSDARAVTSRLGQIFAGKREVTSGQGLNAPIDVLSPLLAPWPEAVLARRYNTWNLVRQIRAALYDSADRPTQLWLFTPDVPEIIKPLQPDHVVYYCVDDFAAFEGFNTNLIEKLERQTAQAADTVVATSEPLMQRMQELGCEPHYIAHGVDTTHFSRALNDQALPEAVRNIPSPILGFFGLITEWVDLELLQSVAQARRDWSLVLLGHTRVDVSLLKDEPNIHLLGGQPYSELPAFCRAFDVGLIPFRMNRLIHAVNPIKLREYLAAGLPVVSAPMPAVMDYKPGVYPAETVEEFINATEAALKANSASDIKARQALVANESWAARVAQLSDIILSAVPRESSNAPQLASM